MSPEPNRSLEAERLQTAIDTHTLPVEPSAEVPQGAEAGGSPSAIDAHEVALDLEWSRLKAELPKAEAAAKQAGAHLKRVKAELEAARQLVAHHRRLHQRLAR
jgi:hypothetical protein